MNQSKAIRDIIIGLKMLINENYYKQIIKKYLVHENSCATVEITMAAIVENYRTKIIHFNFQKIIV